MPRLLLFDSANAVLNRGNATPNKERGPFSDMGIANIAREFGIFL
jgi:hypothetical protein